MKPEIDLGEREANCGCCVIVDEYGLRQLQSLAASRRGGLLVRWCLTCSHFHGRITRRCLEPGCTCGSRRTS